MTDGADSLRIGINAHLLSFTPGYRRAGVSQYTEQMLRHLARIAPERGRALIVFAGPDAPPDGDVPARVRWRRSRLPTDQAPGRILWEQAVAPIATARLGLDLLFCPVNIVPLLGRVPSVVTVHDLAFVTHPETFLPAKRRFLTPMTRLSVGKARRVIAVSARTKADLVHHFHLAPEKITVIPNAADYRFRPADDAAALAAFRRAHDLPERFILFVGTLEPRKNLRRLIQAFKPVAEADPAVALVIIGASGWMTSDIAPLVASLNLQRRIHFEGYVEDDALPRWYQAATLCCYPSLYEGFGLPVLEAMACGTPVVTSATSSLPEVGGDAVRYVDPTDVDELAETLHSLLAASEERSRLRSLGLARAATFSWERTAEATLDVLEAAIREG